MNKTELVALVAEKADMSKAAASRAVDAVLESIQEGVASEGNVTLIGFGTFKTSTRAARTGKNPRTGAALQIAESTVPKFSAGAGFKKAIAK